MKLLITTVGLLLGVVTSVCSQGTVDFRNGGITFPTPADRGVYLERIPGGSSQDTTWVAGLWYFEGDDLSRPTLFNDLIQVGRQFRVRPTTLTFPGGWVAPAGVSPIVTLPGVAIGETSVLQVRVWDAAKFATFDAALALGQFAVSCPFLYTVPPAGSAPDAYYMDNLRAIPCVPEPSSRALLAVAGLGLFLWRRRRSAKTARQFLADADAANAVAVSIESGREHPDPNHPNHVGL